MDRYQRYHSPYYQERDFNIPVYCGLLAFFVITQNHLNSSTY
jgi:hypothetical protein